MTPKEKRAGLPLPLICALSYTMSSGILFLSTPPPSVNLRATPGVLFPIWAIKQTRNPTK
jgi:hypothetical protein